jgi:hypothetical protein
MIKTFDADLRNKAIFDNDISPLGVFAEEFDSAAAASFVLTILTTEYNINFQILNLITNRILQVSPTSYTVAFQTANLLYNRVIQLLKTEYNITEQNLNLLQNRILNLLTTDYDVSGQDLNLLYGRVIQILKTQFDINITTDFLRDYVLSVNKLNVHVDSVLFNLIANIVDTWRNLAVADVIEISARPESRTKITSQDPFQNITLAPDKVKWKISS